MSEEIKRCPYCGEEILAIAIKCKHCGSDLIGETAQAIPLKPVDYSLILIAIPLVATALIWGWVANMNLLQSPGSTLDLIGLFTVAGTALVASIEASKAGMRRDKKLDTYSPITWFILIGLLWIIGYPAYLLKRKHSGLPNKVGVGLVVCVVFLFSYFTMNNAIETKKAEIRQHFEQVQQQFQSLQNNN